MNLENESPLCEEAALEFQATIITELNQILRTNGINKAETRQEILEAFFFNLATAFDGSSDLRLEINGKMLTPCLTFVDESTDPPTLHYSREFDLHDNVGWEVDKLIEDENELG